MILADALARFAADPRTAPSLVAALREIRTFYVPFDPTGVPALLDDHLPAATSPDRVRSWGDPRELPSHLVWALVHARRARTVIVEPSGPHPTTLDAAGVFRVSGPPGLLLDLTATAHPGRARSVAEIHLVLDLLGWPAGARGHAVRPYGTELVATYTWPAAPPGTPAEVAFYLPDPALDPDDFGPGTSPLLDPVGWRCAADLLAPARPPVWSPAWELRFDRAAACLDQALRFYASTEPDAPPDEGALQAGDLVYRLNPARMRRDVVVAARDTLRHREVPR
jgi:hypothetical protein